MSIEFTYHIIITAIIFYILASWFKFFLKLRATVDFSYLVIVIFGTYAGALLNTHFWYWIIVSIFLSFLLSLPITFIILFLSSKLSDVYFSIGTLALYVLAYQLAINMEFITWWVFWLFGMTQNIIWNIYLEWLTDYLILVSIICFFVIWFLIFLKKTYFYTVLKWWWENSTILQVLWVKINIYKFFMISLTTLLAVIWGNLYWFYYLYIDPSSFWISMLVLLLVLIFVSYKFDEIGTFIVSLLIISFYEYLRFFKVVDVTKLWYFREIIFALLIMIVAFFVFRKVNFGRDR